MFRIPLPFPYSLNTQKLGLMSYYIQKKPPIKNNNYSMTLNIHYNIEHM